MNSQIYLRRMAIAIASAILVTTVTGCKKKSRSGKSDAIIAVMDVELSGTDYNQDTINRYEYRLECGARNASNTRGDGSGRSVRFYNIVDDGQSCIIRAEGAGASTTGVRFTRGNNIFYESSSFRPAARVTATMNKQYSILADVEFDVAFVNINGSQVLPTVRTANLTCGRFTNSGSTTASISGNGRLRMQMELGDAETPCTTLTVTDTDGTSYGTIDDTIRTNLILPRYAGTSTGTVVSIGRGQIVLKAGARGTTGTNGLTGDAVSVSIRVQYPTYGVDSSLNRARITCSVGGATAAFESQNTITPTIGSQQDITFYVRRQSSGIGVTTTGLQQGYCNRVEVYGTYSTQSGSRALIGEFNMSILSGSATQNPGAIHLREGTLSNTPLGTSGFLGGGGSMIDLGNGQQLYTEWATRNCVPTYDAFDGQQYLGVRLSIMAGSRYRLQYAKDSDPSRCWQRLTSGQLDYQRGEAPFQINGGQIYGQDFDGYIEGSSLRLNLFGAHSGGSGLSSPMIVLERL